MTHLLQYETERQRHNVPVTMVIDALQRLYSTNFTPAVVLRSLGLHATHSMTFLKVCIISTDTELSLKQEFSFPLSFQCLHCLLC